MARRKKGLGDVVELALGHVGITEEKLSRWLGRPCGCRERKQKLNKLSEWASRVLTGSNKDEALTELSEMAGDPSLKPKSDNPPQG